MLLSGAGFQLMVPCHAASDREDSNTPILHLIYIFKNTRSLDLG